MLAAAALSAPGWAGDFALVTPILPVMERSSSPVSHSTIITGQPGLGHASPAGNTIAGHSLPCFCHVPCDHLFVIGSLIDSFLKSEV